MVQIPQMETTPNHLPLVLNVRIESRHFLSRFDLLRINQLGNISNVEKMGIALN